MAHRPASVGPDSSSSSTAELPPLQGMGRHDVLPEEWTLPHEWKIEKREMFDNWKMDVQNQIANIATNLDQSLQHYPHPEVGRGFNYSDKITVAEREKNKKVQQAVEGGNTLLYGLARLPHTQQF